MPKPLINHNNPWGYNEALLRIKACQQEGKGTSLDLSGLALTTLPPQIGRLTKLAQLSLYGNKLTTLPPEIGKLTKLTKLHLDDNQLTALPPEIGKLTALTHLFLFINQLTTLPPEIGQLSALTHLHLQNNQLTTLPPEFGQLSALNHLVLENNHLTTLPPEFGQLSALNHLYFQNNQLTTLPPEIGQLSALTHLHLQNNHLTALPPEVGQLPALSELYLHGNPTLGISVEALGPSRNDVVLGLAAPAEPKAILAHYFAILAGRTRPLNEVKLILVGDGGRGKTETVNRLVRDEFGGKGKTQETIGINIEDWHLPCPKSDPVDVHVWDFAGQTVTHGLHKFFLSQRSVYVLVLAGRDDKAQSEAEYWLQLIRAFATHDGATSPVIITLNKWESAEENAKVDRRALQEKFPFISGFIETDCKTGYGLDRLKDMVQQAVAADRWVRQPFEKAWWAAKEHFHKMKADTMRYEDYQKTCARLGVSDPNDQQHLARRLHDLGLALNFGAYPRLRLWTVLNPHWVTRTIYQLLREGPMQGTGLMTRKDVIRVLPDETDEQREYLVQLMEEFDLAFAVGDEDDIWLVPQRLETDTPELPEDLKSSTAVRLRWTYKALPEGHLPEFITRTHVLSDELSDLRWANGVVLMMENARVLVRADREDKTITAIAAYPHPELMRHVEGELDALNSEIPGLQAKKEIEVLPGAWLDVSLLRKMEPRGTPVPVTVRNVQGDDDLEMVMPKEQLNRIGPERSRDEDAWRPLIFISYTDGDRKSLEKLCKDYLRCHEHTGLMEIWHDKQITPGTDWNPEIMQKIAAADIILLLLSPRAMGSDYIRQQEIPLAIERHQNEGIPIIPVLLEETDVSATGLKAIQGIKDLWRTPVRDTKPQRHAWFQIADELKRLCTKMLEQPAKHASSFRR